MNYGWWYIWKRPSIPENGGRRAPNWFLRELKKRDPLAYPIWNPNARRIIIKKGPMAGKVMKDGRWEIWRENWNGAVRNDYKVFTVFTPSQILISVGNEIEGKKFYTKQAYLGEYRHLDMRVIWQLEGKKWEHQGVKGGTQDPVAAKQAREELDRREDQEMKDQEDEKKIKREYQDQEIERDIEREILPLRTGVLVGKHAQAAKKPVLVGTQKGAVAIKKDDASKVASHKAFERIKKKDYGVWPVVEVKEKR